MRGTLIVTNDFPPRQGGIQSFVHGLACLLPPDQVAVYAPAWDGAKAFDSRQPFRVIRPPPSLMLPVPGVARRAVAALREHDCDTVMFGAAAPLGLLAPTLRRAGATRQVALTHGHEAGWAQLPVAGSLLRRIGDGVDVLTYLGEYTRSRMARVSSSRSVARISTSMSAPASPRTSAAASSSSAMVSVPVAMAHQVPSSASGPMTPGNSGFRTQ